LLYGLIAGVIEVFGYSQPTFYLLFAPFSMLTLFHYYIDGKIWKFSQCPELNVMFLPPESVSAAAALQPESQV
jgi:hypothetical protein